MSDELGGVGISLVSVPRFDATLRRFGSRFTGRVFTPDEVAYAQRRRNGAQSLAARFAAKCAGRSVLARLREEPVALRDVEVVRRASGEPTLAVRGVAERVLAGSDRLTVSLTHDHEFALASVWLVRGTRRVTPRAR